MRSEWKVVTLLTAVAGFIGESQFHMMHWWKLAQNKAVWFDKMDQVDVTMETQDWLIDWWIDLCEKYPVYFNSTCKLL